MRLKDEIEEAWTKFRKSAEEAGANEPDDAEFVHATDRDPISDQWLTKGRLVRLDDLIFAMHILSARHSFHGLTKLKTKILINIAERIGAFIAGAAAKKVLGQFIGRTPVVRLVSLIAATVEDSAIQRDSELSVRIASFEVRSDLYREPMKANPKRRRKTKLVFTRHPIPPQRKPNKQWRSPKR